MVYTVWAIDAPGGQAIIWNGEDWFLLSIDNNWHPVKLRDRNDALRWANSVPALPSDQTFESFTEITNYVRQRCLSHLEVPDLSLADVKGSTSNAFLYNFGSARDVVSEAIENENEEVTNREQNSIPIFISWLEDEDIATRLRATEILARTGQTVIPYLLLRIQNDSTAIRWITPVLTQIGLLAVPILSESLGDTRADVRRSAADALGQMGETAQPAIALLNNLLSDKEFTVRSAAIEALSRIRLYEFLSVPALCATLQDETVYMRRKAATLLAQMGASAKPAIPFLDAVRSDKDITVRTAAVDALSRIGTVNIGMASLEDIALMERLAGRDQHALLTLYEQYGKDVYSLAYRILGNATYAEETMQDTFLKIWHQTNRWDSDKGKLKNWVLTIARFTAMDRLRKEGRQLTIQDTDESQLTSKNEEPWQDASILRMLVSQLPPQQASLIELAFFQGLSHGEIAEALNMPLGTVKTRLRAGLQKLREMWLDYATSQENAPNEILDIVFDK